MAMFCGKSPTLAVAAVAAVAFLLLILVASPFLLVGLIFLPLLELYGLKLDSSDKPELDLANPLNWFLLVLAILAALAIIALVSLHW